MLGGAGGRLLVLKLAARPSLGRNDVARVENRRRRWAAPRVPAVVVPSLDVLLLPGAAFSRPVTEVTGVPAIIPVVVVQESRGTVLEVAVL